MNKLLRNSVVRGLLFVTLALSPMTVNAHGTNPQEGDIDSTDVFYLHLKLKDVVVTGATGETRLKNSSATLLKMAVGSDINIGGTHVAVVQIIGDNLLNTVYQSHLSRLKYAPLNPVTGNRGIHNMGRNITFKLSIPVEL